MQFSDKMLEIKKHLEEKDHSVIVSDFIENYAGKDDDKIEKLKLDDKFNKNATKRFWSKMIDADAILIVNLDKNGVKNYVGGAALLDMGFAYFLNQKIFLWNPIPDIPYYNTEIQSMKPIVINGDISKIN